MATTRTFGIRSKTEASDIISAIHNHFFNNDNDEMVIEENDDNNGNITLLAWDDWKHYNVRSYPPTVILRRMKTDK